MPLDDSGLEAGEGMVSLSWATTVPGRGGGQGVVLCPVGASPAERPGLDMW